MTGRAENDEPPRRDPDPTLVTSQPALRTSSGAIWIIVGALFTAVCLIPLTAILAAGGAAGIVAAVTAGLLVAGLVAMVVVRVTAPDGPSRLKALAACLLGIALVALAGMATCVMLVWAPLTG